MGTHGNCWCLLYFRGKDEKNHGRGQHISHRRRTLLPGLTKLPRFCNGGGVITAIVVAISACGRRSFHTLHVRAVFVSRCRGCTGLQGQCNAQQGESHDNKSSHISSLALCSAYVTRFFDVSPNCAVMHFPKYRLRSRSCNDAQFSGYVVNLR